MREENEAVNGEVGKVQENVYRNFLCISRTGV